MPFAQHTPPDDAAGDAPTQAARENPRTSRRTSAVTAPGPKPAPGDPLLAFSPFPHVAPRRDSLPS